MRTPSARRLTAEEITAIKQARQPVSPDALAWAEACAPEIDAMRQVADTSRFPTFSEFRKRVYRRLRGQREPQSSPTGKGE